MKRILLIDNYDSFVYNLFHLMKEVASDNVTIDVFRNDKLSIDDVAMYDKILISPGPGVPNEAGIICDVIRRYAESKSILGVCLGCQAIGEVFGGTLVNMGDVCHGVAMSTVVTDSDDYLFQGVPSSFLSGRYHSWVVDSSLPSSLRLTATDESGKVMALRHESLDVRGVQFHPESVLTPNGRQIIANWVNH